MSLTAYKVCENTGQLKWVGENLGGESCRFIGTGKNYSLECLDGDKGVINSLDMSEKTKIAFDVFQVGMYVAKTVEKDKKKVLPKDANLLILMYMLAPTTFKLPRFDVYKEHVFDYSSKAGIVILHRKSLLCPNALSIFELPNIDERYHMRPMISPDGTLVLYCGKGKTIKAWDIIENRVRFSIKIPTKVPIVGWSISGDNSTVAALLNYVGLKLLVWNTNQPNAEPVIFSTNHSSPLHFPYYEVKCSHDGSAILVNWEYVGYSIFSPFSKLKREIHNPFEVRMTRGLVAFHPQGKAIAYFEKYQTKREIHITHLNDTITHDLIIVDYYVDEIAFSPDGNILMCNCIDKIKMIPMK